MSQIHEESTPHAPALNLDPCRVGEMILRVPLSSALAHHEFIADTMRDYVKPRNPELEFIRDLFTKSTQEICDRWYGGEFNASALASNSLARHYGARDLDE